MEERVVLPVSIVSELASQSKRSNLQKASKIVVYRYRSG